MSVVVPTVTKPSRNVIQFSYAAMVLTDTGTPIHEQHADYSDRTVQFTGTLGAAGALTIQGSNDGGTTYATLTDQSDNALVLTALKIETIMQGANLVRPQISAGDGTTSLTVIIVCRRPRSGREG